MINTTIRSSKANLGYLFLLLAFLSSAARGATLVPIGPLNLSHGANLIQNGSFEDHPNAGVSPYYWATGTSNAPFASPANWVASGSSPNYALWGNTAVGGFGINSDVLPDGNSALYFGNQLLSAISETPAFNADGTVIFTNPAVITPAVGYSPPVTLSQTLTGLTPNSTYGLSFWGLWRERRRWARFQSRRHLRLGRHRLQQALSGGAQRLFRTRAVSRL